MTNWHKRITEILEGLSRLNIDENGYVHAKVDGLNIRAFTPMGEWDASGGIPPPATETGQFWWISVAGIIDEIDYEVNDWIVCVSTDPSLVFKKIDNSDKYIPPRNCGQYWVSEDFGDDENGDGSINKPFQTIQNAIDVAGGGSVEIIIDESVGRDSIQTVSCPSGMIVSVISTTSGFGNSTHVGLDIILPHNTSKFHGDNLVINNISAVTGATLYLEECYQKGTLSGGVFNIYSFGTRFTDIGAKIYGLHYYIPTNEWCFRGGDAIYINNFLKYNKILTEEFNPMEVQLAGETPSDSDLKYPGTDDYWAHGAKGIGVGTTGRVFLMYNAGESGSPSVKYVELS